jgi:hypothetical protein
MLNLLITLLVIFVVAGLCYWAVNKLAAAFELPAPIVTVIQVVLVIIFVIILLGQLTGRVQLGGPLLH